MANLVRRNPMVDRSWPAWPRESMFGSGDLWSDFFAPWTGSMFDRMVPASFWNEFAWPTPFAGADWSVGSNLALDVAETEDELIVRATLPGVRPEDVQIDEQDGWLRIRAQQAEENEWDDAGWYMRERRATAWQRTFQLPVEVNVDKAEATLENGILTVHLPKVQSSQPLLKRIPVKLPKLGLPKRNKTKVEVNGS